MKRALLLLALLPSLALGQVISKPGKKAAGVCPSTGASCPVATDPAQNAVLYVPFNNAPGCYATGSTALATNGAAMTFTRNSVAYMPDSPGGGWWRSCTANQLRVSGNWAGAILDAPGTNLFATPTDSPTSSGNWSLIAAGPTVTANNVVYKFLDGTYTGTSFTEAAGVVSGIQQSVTTTAGQQCQSAIFLSNARDCWGYAVDGSAQAKFNINTGAVTWCPTWPDCTSSTATVKAGIEHLGNGFTRPWACYTTTAAAHNIQFFATAACADSTVAATGGTALTPVIARTMLEAAVSFTPSQATTYAATGTNRPQDVLSFPLALTDGNLCIGAKVEPYGSTWAARSQSGIASAYSASFTLGAADSMVLYASPATAYCTVYDHAAASRGVQMNIPAGTSPRAFKCCTTAAGAVSMGVDGAISSEASGAGTGILTTLPTTMYVGTIAGVGPYQQVNSGSYSDVVACGASAQGNPNLCGDWLRPAARSNLAIGDSITAGIGISGVTVPWTSTAATAAGINVAQMSRSGWGVQSALAAYQANRGHRWKRVAVFIGTNDIGGLGTATFDYLRQIYAAIIADGAIPVPVTITPRGLTTTEVRRTSINASILQWCAISGNRCADLATHMDDGTGHLKAAYDSGDGLHPNQAGQDAIGAFMAPYLQ